MKLKEQIRAVELRKEGKSVRAISTALGVSKGSVSCWVRNVKLTEDQAIALAVNQTTGSAHVGIAHEAYIEKCRLTREQYQQEGRQKARENDSDHKAMCMLFWAEGSKDRNSCKMTNSDVRMMVYFVSLLRRFFSLNDDRFRVNFKVHIDNGISLTEIEQWWLTRLQLPRSCLNKASVDHRIVSGKNGRKNRLHHGVCTVTVNETRVVQHLYGAIQEYVGFEDHSWRDKSDKNVNINVVGVSE